MALPPIIANLPIIRMFRSDSAPAGAKTDEKKNASSPRDVVDISGRVIANEDQARGAAADTRNLLESHPEAFLGLDPAFS